MSAEIINLVYATCHITTGIWDHVKQHITDEVPQGVSAYDIHAVNLYNDIKHIQETNRGQEICYIRCHNSLNHIITFALALAVDYQTECLTMDTPSVVLVVNNKQCKLAQLLLSVMSAHPSTFIIDVLMFLELLHKQGTVHVMLSE
jgi:hypothetical protein